MNVKLLVFQRDTITCPSPILSLVCILQKNTTLKMITWIPKEDGEVLQVFYRELYLSICMYVFV